MPEQWRELVQGKVMTVVGLIPAESLGVTLAHEHLLCNLLCYWVEPTIHDPVHRWKLANALVSIELLDEIKRRPMGTVRDNLLLDDIQSATSEAADFKLVGGNTIVELTNIGLGRDPSGLQEIARATGLNIIAGCGYYIQRSHPNFVSQKTAEQLAQTISDDILVGIEGGGVRAGVIGEIGISHDPHKDEEKVLRAACIAQRQTGVAISLHAMRLSKENSLRLLDQIEAEGCDPHHIIFGHQDKSISGHVDVDLHKSIARRGAYVQYDSFGTESYAQTSYPTMVPSPTDFDRVQAIRELKDAGYFCNILLSQDVCLKHQLRRYGGAGYSHIMRNVLSIFRSQGFSNDDIRTLLIQNPQRVFCIEPD